MSTGASINKKDPTTRIRTRDRPMAAIYPLQSDALPTELLSETYWPPSISYLSTLRHFYNFCLITLPPDIHQIKKPTNSKFSIEIKIIFLYSQTIQIYVLHQLQQNSRLDTCEKILKCT